MRTQTRRMLEQLQTVFIKGDEGKHIVIKGQEMEVGGMARPVDAVFGELVAWASMLTPQQLGLLLASSLLSGAGATWFQSNGQRKASAPKAQLWFAMTPVFGAFWAFVILGEQFTYHQISGAVALIGAIVLSIPRPEDSRPAEST